MSRLASNPFNKMKNRGRRLSRKALQKEISEIVDEIAIGALQKIGDIELPRKDANKAGKQITSILHDLRRGKPKQANIKEKILLRELQKAVDANTPIVLGYGAYETEGGIRITLTQLYQSQDKEWTAYHEGISLRYSNNGDLRPTGIFKSGVRVEDFAMQNLYWKYTIKEKVPFLKSGSNTSYNNDYAKYLYAKMNPQFPVARLKIGEPEGKSKTKHILL